MTVVGLANLHELGSHLAVTYLFGAARASGTPEQVARLRDEALPMLQDHEVTLQEVAAKVFDVMGLQWKLPPEWLKAINALGGTT